MKKTTEKIQKTMNKEALVNSISQDSGLSKADCKRVLESMTLSIGKALQDGKKVTIVGFGSFEISERKPRTARNPRTGESIQVPATKYPKFKAGKPFRNALS
jgi:DNA-binding protein HU-beta